MDMSNSKVMVQEERGTALLEFAIVVWGVVFGILIVLDVSLAVSQYMLFSQASYEGLRLGTTLPELEVSPAEGYTDITASTEEEEACVQRLPSAIPCQHYLIHDRIRRALENINLFDRVGILGGPQSITTFYVPSSAGTGTNDDTITVRLVGNYTGFFLPDIPLVIDLQGAYLFEDI